MENSKLKSLYTDDQQEQPPEYFMTPQKTAAEPEAPTPTPWKTAAEPEAPTQMPWSQSGDPWRARPDPWAAGVQKQTWNQAPSATPTLAPSGGWQEQACASRLRQLGRSKLGASQPRQLGSRRPRPRQS